MILATLGQIWTTYHQEIVSFGSIAFGYAFKTFELVAARTRAKLDAGQQALQLVATMQATVTSYSAELEQLRASRWAADNVLVELHGQVIAARLLVHDLEQRLGLPATVFSALPGLPTAPTPPQTEQHQAGAPS